MFRKRNDRIARISQPVTGESSPPAKRHVSDVELFKTMGITIQKAAKA